MARTGLLSGKAALITGGGRGIGRAISLAFAAEGARVALTYRTNRDAAEMTLQDITQSGGEAIALAMEVRHPESISAAFGEAARALGPLSVLVNNAGVNKPADFDAISPEDWDEIIDINLKGPFLVAQAALGHLERAGGGSIVHIGSVSGQYGGPRTAHYAASKAGLISLAQVIARFGGARNIRSNTIAAGLIGSEMAEAGLASPAVQQAAESIILKRLGTPEEVAQAAVFLASDRSSYITAQCLNVNGGLYF